MDFIKKNIANVFTLGNLFSGCVGSIQLILGNYEITAICIIISLILDFFDGFIARAMKANSEMGIQLDSLADMVSFGLLPGLTMYKMLELQGYSYDDVKYLGLLITIFSCVRLAIFNIDTEQKYYFKGLNTPSNTILIFGVYYAYQSGKSFEFLVNNIWILIGLTVFLSWLLISPIKMIAMKFKSMKLADNYPKIALLVGSVFILIFGGIVGIPSVIVYYILVSIVFQKQLK